MSLANTLLFQASRHWEPGSCARSLKLCPSTIHGLAFPFILFIPLSLCYRNSHQTLETFPGDYSEMTCANLYICLFSGKWLGSNTQGLDFGFLHPVSCCNKADLHSIFIKPVGAFSSINFSQKRQFLFSKSTHFFVQPPPPPTPRTLQIWGWCHQSNLLRWKEEGPHPPTADPFTNLTASALSSPLSSALVSLLRRGIFCCPMCPETNTQEEAGNPQGVSQLPQGTARNGEVMRIRTSRASWSRNRTDQNPLPQRGKPYCGGKINRGAKGSSPGPPGAQ